MGDSVMHSKATAHAKDVNGNQKGIKIKRLAVSIGMQLVRRPGTALHPD
jgi:hypothetical protein